MSSSRRGLLQRIGAAVPALLLGMAAGVGGGAWAAHAMDATPYGETDLNTISRQSQQAGSEEGYEQAEVAAAEVTARLKEANAKQVEQLKTELKKADGATKDVKKELTEQAEKLARVQSSLAETTASLENATSQPATGSGDGQAIEGTLRSSWTLRTDDKPWPKDCSKALQTYSVRVTAGAGATVAEGQLVGAETVKRKETKKVLTLVCSMTYRASIPSPLGDGYEVVVLDGSKGDAEIASKTASSAALANGSGPAITVTG